ncbi:MAG: cytochrome c oxidase subunit [Gaiellales bacterium]|nr:cytochrome c oxidase subunit [Gaiellales bacterium]
MRSTRGEFQHLFWGLYAPVTGGAVVLVLIATSLLVLRYRGTHRPAARSSNVTLELVAACALAAIAAVLLTETFSAEGSVDELHRPGLVVDATGFQWGWTFAYPGTGVSTSSGPRTPARLVVPVGEVVEIRLRSRDVIHALWVPEQRFKRLAFPDRVTRFDLRFDRAGRFEGRCSTFCGLRHDVMTVVVDARRAADFRRWLRQQETQA